MIIVSGMRPTGELHLGNLEGALRSWIELQQQEDNKCYYFVADWHALTTDFKDTQKIKEATIDMVATWLSVGIDEKRSIIFRQSDIKEVSELHLLLSMITPIGWLNRCPTYKEQIKELKLKEDEQVYGFLGYPVLQAADILAYKGEVVPVGQDQLPHIDLIRDITSRFNSLYKKIFKLPIPKLTKGEKLLGIDGKKMSKSYNNYIKIIEEKEVLNKKISKMFTDPQRIHVEDVGHPDGCVVFSFYSIYKEDNIYDIRKRCEGAKISCVACKEELANLLDNFLEPIREKYYHLIKDKDRIEDILREGKERASQVAKKTLEEVREAMKI